MSNAIQELKDSITALENRIDTLRPLYLENKEALKSEWESLNEQLKDYRAQHSRALGNQASSK